MNELDAEREALLQTFLAEAEEIFVQMEQALVALETRSGDEEILHALFRHAHTLKGSAGLVAFDDVRDVAHDLETVLDRLRKRSLSIDDSLITLLLRSVDVLRAAVAEGTGQGAGARETTAAFRARLAAAAGPRGETSVDGACWPPSEDVPPRELAVHRPARQGRSLRVDVAKLDRMLDTFGEIAIARGRLGEILARGGAGAQALEAHREAERLYVEMQDLIMRARMVPIGPLFHQHVRTVRDVATAQGKRVRLLVEGEDVEVDTAMVEGVRDPLLHVVRNALDHGIEAPSTRQSRGKEPTGTVVLRAFREARTMVIQVLDDGAGLDRRRIAEKAAALGLTVDPSRAEDIARAVFHPGFSTAERVTEISGRGVGMDVVRRNVEALRGSVTLESEEGRGTTVTIRLPLTLAIVQGFSVGVAGQVYILPLEDVVECRELPAAETETAARTPVGVLDVRGKPLPFLRLRDYFDVGGARPRRENVVIVRHGSGTAGIAVDELHGESSTVIKPLGPSLRGASGIAGSSILGNGRVALVLDVAAVLRETLRRAAGDAAVVA